MRHHQASNSFPGPPPSPGLLYRAVKRTIDLTVGLVATVITAPVVVVLLVGSAVVFRANPLFVQPRVGRGGRLVPVPKIRSIPAAAPSTADKHQLASIHIPAWGRLIRRLHLDEVPQFWSVLTGHMSLVGPRPEMPHLVERFDPEFAEARHSVRPGVTGLWQISEGVSGLIGETPEYDWFYLHRASTRFDLWLLRATVRQYLPGGRLLCFDDLPTWVQPPGDRVDTLAMSASGGR